MSVAGHVKKTTYTHKKTESEMACVPSKGDFFPQMILLEQNSVPARDRDNNRLQFLSAIDHTDTL